MKLPLNLPSTLYETFTTQVASLDSLSALPSDYDSFEATRRRVVNTAPVRQEDARTADPEYRPEMNPDYTLLNLIAQGGVGEVWEARQESLGRTIAVKRLRWDLRESCSDNPRRLRQLEHDFRHEAFLAASLEHPNVLPVHDLGLDEEGNLLIAMKRVGGKPWYQLLRQDWPTLGVEEFLAKHLTILIDVGQAVAFAHSRGIVHRDLKPSQVMVGEFGEVLLMDWGIALVYDPERNRRESDSLIVPMLGAMSESAANPAGTVAYMAPEQTEDTVSNIGPWTDVYLLGAVLYELLTGRRPHEADSPKAAFFLAAEGKVQPPREAAPEDREVPLELDILAMRCLALSPLDRPRSAEEVVDELRGFLTGASRRREAEVLIGEVAESLAKGAIEYIELAEALEKLSRARTLWPGNTEAGQLRQDLLARYSRVALQSRDLRLARLQAERLSPCPTREDLLAEIARREEEQRRADERLEAAFNRARKARERAERLLAFVLQDLHEGLKQVNRLDLLARVGNEALDYFDAFPDEEDLATDHESRLAALRNRAVACRNLGDVFRAKGDLTAALQAFREFQGYARNLVELDPEDPAYRSDLAESHERIGTVLYFQGNPGAALEEHQAALSMLIRLSRNNPGDVAIRNRLAHASHQVGVAHWRKQETDQALEMHLRALRILEELAAKHPADRAIRGNLGWCLATFGNVYRDRNELAEAIRVTERSVLLREELREEEPANMQSLDDLCWSVSNLALIQEFAGEFDDALVTYSRAMALRRELAEGDPANAMHRNMLTFLLSCTGRMLYNMERPSEAAKYSGEAVDLSSQLSAADPTNARERGSHALNCGYYAQVLAALGKSDSALSLAREAIAGANQALEKMPGNGVFQNAYCQGHLALGMALEGRGEPGPAQQAYETALAMLRPSDWEDQCHGAGIAAELYLRARCEDDARRVFLRMRERGWMTRRYDRLARAMNC
ncbi:MAG: protein kinase [Sumerlaeia bacterium]